jgi:ComF family protein
VGSVLALLRALLEGPRCAGCERLGETLCRACRPHAFESETHVIAARGGELGATMSVVSLARYDGSLRNAILAYKAGRRALAPVFGSLLSAVFGTRLPAGVFIVPVPSTAKRRAERGFDHTALLAREVARRSCVPVACILEQYDGPAQRGRSRTERLLSDKRFSCHDVSLVGKHIVLVDDVVTTGATLRGCAIALRAVGAQSVEAIVLATVVRQSTFETWARA